MEIVDSDKTKLMDLFEDIKPRIEKVYVSTKDVVYRFTKSINEKDMRISITKCQLEENTKYVGFLRRKKETYTSESRSEYRCIISIHLLNNSVRVFDKLLLETVTKWAQSKGFERLIKDF